MNTVASGGKDGRSGKVRTYRDLLVWQKSMDLVAWVYEVTNNFPRQEQYGLTVQIRRAAVSIPSNIAEGTARNSDGDFVRFLRIACGSLYEMNTQIEIALRLGFLKQAESDRLASLSREVEKMLSGLIGRIQRDIE